MFLTRTNHSFSLRGGRYHFREADSAFPDDVPTYHRFPLALFGKLIRARIAMALGR